MLCACSNMKYSKTNKKDNNLEHRALKRKMNWKIGVKSIKKDLDLYQNDMVGN